SQAIEDAGRKKSIVADCCTLIDEEVAGKSGLSGLAVKAGYAAVKGVKPGFIAHVVDQLLKEFADAVDPIWAEGMAQGNPTSYFQTHRSRVAEALLAVTDEKSKKAKSGVVRGTYEKLRGSAKRNVEDAVPRLGKLLEKHAAK